MTTFFQVVGYAALAIITFALFDMIYFKHFRWRNGYQAWTGKKFVSRYSGPRKKKEPRVVKEVLSNKIYTPYDEEEQT
jgi:hypothetical protein